MVLSPVRLHRCELMSKSDQQRCQRRLIAASLSNNFGYSLEYRYSIKVLAGHAVSEGVKSNGNDGARSPLGTYSP